MGNRPSKTNYATPPPPMDHAHLPPSSTKHPEKSNAQSEEERKKRLAAAEARLAALANKGIRRSGPDAKKAPSASGSTSSFYSTVSEGGNSNRP